MNSVQKANGMLVLNWREYYIKASKNYEMNLNHNKNYIWQMEFKPPYNYPFWKKLSVYYSIYMPSKSPRQAKAKNTKDRIFSKKGRASPGPHVASPMVEVSNEVIPNKRLDMECKF